MIFILNPITSIFKANNIFKQSNRVTVTAPEHDNGLPNKSQVTQEILSKNENAETFLISIFQTQIKLSRISSKKHNLETQFNGSPINHFVTVKTHIKYIFLIPSSS